MSLDCGCEPDASGFGWCSECVRKLREKIRRKMPEKEKRYDRHFAPAQSAALDSVMDDYDHDRGCSCHINPPCSYCEGRSEEGG
jgi:hypothetical protein